jgi:hypothetical protein
VLDQGLEGGSPGDIPATDRPDIIGGVGSHGGE